MDIKDRIKAIDNKYNEYTYASASNKENWGKVKERIDTLKSSIDEETTMYLETNYPGIIKILTIEDREYTDKEMLDYSKKLDDVVLTLVTIMEKELKIV